jgi:hypothetical protein
MTDQEKIIKGLECCKWSRQNVKPEKNKCNECPYKERNVMNAYTVWQSCTNVLAGEALALLKNQERRINGLEEKLRLIEYGDQDILQSIMMPAT